jgi:hypothetical protein
VQEVSRHPEVDQENATRLELNNQILAAAIERGDTFSLQLGGHSGRVEGPGETFVEDLDTLKTPPDQLRLEPRADGFDLGQLRHASSLALRG